MRERRPTRGHNARQLDRGESEVLGYVLLFSFVTLAVTTVFVLGTSHVEHVRETEQRDSAVQTFETLADAIDDHLRRHATVRSTALRTTGGELSFETEETIRLEVVSSERNQSRTASPSLLSLSHTVPIAYTSTSGSTVVYAHGAVFREGPGYSRMIREPTAQFGDDRVVFPMVATTGDERVAVSNAGATQIQTERAFSETVSEMGPGQDLQITVRTTEPRAAAWRRYFETTNGLVCEGIERGAITCTASDIDMVYVASVVVETGFE